VSGLGVGKTLTLQNNAGNDLPLNANGAFGFTTPVVSGGNYLVTIKTQPAQQACSVSDGSGTVSASSVASISVVCTNSAISTNYLKTSGAQLLDAAGNAVVLRGVNVPVFKSGYADDLVQVVAAVKASGSNAARIVWWSTPPQGTTQYTIANLEEAIRTVAHSGMLPIVELHDATCYLALPQASCNDATIFNNRITNFWIRQDVMAILQKYQGYLIVNLANEWGRLPSEDGDASAFTNHYATVIQTVRNAWNGAGLSNIPLMVDAPNGGSYSGAFLGQHISGATNGQHLINSDPGHNVLLSTHAYWPTSEGHTDNSISQRLEALANSGLPFVLGEVGSNANGSCGATDEVPWRTIMNKAVQ
jgi:mannan endo-1,4-beta-mannosidase